MESRRRQGNTVAGRITAIMFVAACCLALACTADREGAPRPPRSIVTDVIVTVENPTSRALLIYVRAGSWSDSLGVVGGRSSRSFALPSGAADSASALQLEARRRRAGDGVMSQVFRLSAGHQVLWTVDPNRRGKLLVR